jgi:hypothetical protein
MTNSDRNHNEVQNTPSTRIELTEIMPGVILGVRVEDRPAYLCDIRDTTRPMISEVLGDGCVLWNYPAVQKPLKKEIQED